MNFGIGQPSDGMPGRRGWRRLGRWLRPTTPWITLLGVDGTGKSTVLQALNQALPLLPYAGLYVLHRRPRLIYRASATPTPGQIEHYGKPVHGALLSSFKLWAMWLDWLVGYFWHIRGRQAEGILVIADRHSFLDILADPQRYRYGGPVWLARWLIYLLPMPSTVLLLDAPVPVLQARKPELSPEKSAVLREAYLRLVEPMPNHYVIDASQPLTQVVAAVVEALRDEG